VLIYKSLKILNKDVKKWQYQKEKLQNLVEIKEELITKYMRQLQQFVQIVASNADLIIFVQNAVIIMEKKY
jgi:hypothetical protein